MLRNFLVDHFIPDCFQRRQCPGLVGAHHPAIADDVGSENSGQSAFHVAGTVKRQALTRAEQTLPRKRTASTVHPVIASTFRSPLNNCAGPGQATTEHDHQYVIALLDSTGAIRFIQCDRYRCGRCISVSIKVNENFLARNSEPFPDRFDNSKVRLMWNYASDVIDGEASLVDGFSGCRQHCDDSLFINFLSRHVNRLQMQMRVFRGDWRFRSTAWL